MILLLGSTGQVGTAFRTALAGEVTTPDREELDLLEIERLGRRLRRFDPTAIINCAAYTDVDRAEIEPEIVRTVNSTAVELLADFSAEREIPLVTFSTDYVFDGSATSPYLESSAPAPINEYGRSKALGETLALNRYPDALVVRTSWVISTTHPNFVTQIIDRASRGSPVTVIDQVGSPTFAPDLAAATIQAMERGAAGILHLANQGETSRYELARAALALAGLDPDLVERAGSRERRGLARRPRYSALASERLTALDLAALPDWRESLRFVARPG